MIVEITAKSENLQSEAYDFEFGVKSFNVQTMFSFRSACFFPEDFLFLRAARHPADSNLVPRYWPGYQWYHGIRTTLDQHCTADCCLALRYVYSPKAIATFL